MKELTRDRVVPIISVSFPWRCQRCGNTTPIIGVRHLNRHCPKCQGAAAKEWLAGREAELLPVPYYHVVFTLPARVGDGLNLRVIGRPRGQPTFRRRYSGDAIRSSGCSAAPR